MCDCNSKRASYNADQDPTKMGMVKIKLVENPPRILHGEVTGRTYIFRKMKDILWVDKRDSISMQSVRGLQVLPD